MNKLLCVCLVAALSGCSLLPKRAGNQEVVVIRPAERVAPAAAMQPCPPLGELSGDTFGDVVRKLAQAAQAYALCESRRRELAGFISGAGGSTISDSGKSSDKR